MRSRFDVRCRSYRKKGEEKREGEKKKEIRLWRERTNVAVQRRYRESNMAVQYSGRVTVAVHLLKRIT